MKLAQFWRRKKKPNWVPYAIGRCNARLLDDLGRPVAMDVPAVFRFDLPAWIDERHHIVHGRASRPAVVVVMIPLLLGSLALPRSATTPFAAMAVMHVAILFAVAIGIRIRWPRLWRRWLRPAYLHIGRCPTCVYDLSGAEPDEAGLLHCAECGGAWRPPTPDEVRLDDPDLHRGLDRKVHPGVIFGIAAPPVLLVLIYIGVTGGVLVLMVLVLAVLIPLGMFAAFSMANRPPPPPWICEGCGYDLRGLTGIECPECGQIRPAQSPALSTNPPRDPGPAGGDRT